MKKIYNSRVELLSDIDAGVDVSNTDVSKVTDMSYMFFDSTFNGDISLWDLSKGIDMSGMFYKSMNCVQPMRR